MQLQLSRKGSQTTSKLQAAHEGSLKQSGHVQVSSPTPQTPSSTQPALQVGLSAQSKSLQSMKPSPSLSRRSLQKAPVSLPPPLELEVALELELELTEEDAELETEEDAELELTEEDAETEVTDDDATLPPSPPVPLAPPDPGPAPPLPGPSPPEPGPWPPARSTPPAPIRKWRSSPPKPWSPPRPRGRAATASRASRCMRASCARGGPMAPPSRA